MKKLLITGSSGFLGSRLALYYKDKYELLLPTHSELNVSREEAVMAYMEQTLELPGGIYNYGSGNHIDSYTLFLKVANIMGAKEPSTFILPDEERFSEQTRNLTMDYSQINNFGIRFNDSVEGIEKALMNRKP